MDWPYSPCPDKFFPQLQGNTSTLATELINDNLHFLKVISFFKLVQSSDGSSVSKSKAKCFIKLMTDDNVMMYAAFLLDVLSVLQITSKVFQNENGTAADIHRSLKTSRLALLQFNKRDGTNLSKMKSGESSSGYKVKDSKPKLFESEKQKLLQKLDDTLSLRYADTDSGVIQASIIVDFNCWPDMNDESKTSEEFGDDHVKCLLDHYKDCLLSAGVDIEAAMAEWPLLKIDVYSSFSDLSTLGWHAVNKRFKQYYANILSLIDLVLTIPSSSAQCERGFSTMKKTKTDVRNRLDEQSLTDSMVIQLESDSLENFDPTPAIHIWNTKLNLKARRPNFNDTNRIRTPKTTTVITEDSHNMEEDQSQEHDMVQVGEESQEQILKKMLKVMNLKLKQMRKWTMIQTVTCSNMKWRGKLN